MMVGQHEQRGIILIGLMVVLVLAAGATFMQQANRSNAMAVEREAKTTAALLAARDALLARAVIDATRPGSLRCPSLDTSGNTPFATPCPAYIGRLPWRTLDSADFRDGSGTPLWYALAPAFRDGNTALNHVTSAATISLNGQADIVALIIAPNGALPGQNRPSNDVADYLDDLGGNPATSNRDGNQQFHFRANRSFLQRSGYRHHQGGMAGSCRTKSSWRNSLCRNPSRGGATRGRHRRRRTA